MPRLARHRDPMTSRMNEAIERSKGKQLTGGLIDSYFFSRWPSTALMSCRINIIIGDSVQTRSGNKQSIKMRTRQGGGGCESGTKWKKQDSSGL